MSTKKSSTAPRRHGKASKLDAHVALLGTMSDLTVAKLVGVTPKAVAQYRLRRKIPAFVDATVAAEPAPVAYGAAAKLVPAPAPEKAPTKAPGKPAKARTPAKVAAPAKASKAKQNTPAKQKASAKGKPAASKATAPVPAKSKNQPAPTARGKRRTASAILDARRDIIGVLDDRAAAKQVGVSHETVRKYRIEHHIPSAASRTQAASAPAVTAAPAPKTPKAGTPKPGAVPAKTAVVAPTAPVIKRAGATSVCWRGTVAGGAPVYVVANGLGAAAARLEAALGAAVTSVERVGPAVG